MATQMAAAGEEREGRRACTVDEVTTAVRQCWSSMFPDDLLAVVYRMVASPRGRARFAAVCRPWRAAARAAPPAAALPWLLLSPCDTDNTKRLHCPEDRAIVRVLLPGGRVLVGCHDGGWVATYTMASLRIVNILSGAEVKLVNDNFQHHVRDTVLKIVFSKSPTSGDCILAAVSENPNVWSGIRLCKIGCTNNSEWTMRRYSGMPFVDIAFCNSNLYGLRKNGTDIVEFEIGVNEDGAPVVIARRRLAMQSIADPIRMNIREDVSYIIDLHGKVAMARRANWSPNKAPFFKVFEIVDINSNKLATSYKWVEVTNLGDHALFLGRTFSKLVNVSANKHGGVERNHIYFSHHRSFSLYDAIPAHAVFLGISNGSGDEAYYMEDDGENGIAGDEVKRIRSIGYFTKVMGAHGFFLQMSSHPRLYG